MFLYTCSALYFLLGSDQLNSAQLSSVFCYSGPYNLSLSNLPLVYIPPYPRLYYGIEVINNPNIDLIFIIVTRMQSTTRNTAGILVLKSNPASHFCPGCAEQAQN